MCLQQLMELLGRHLSDVFEAQPFRWLLARQFLEVTSAKALLGDRSHEDALPWRPC
jgi:hypothetical protein